MNQNVSLEMSDLIRLHRDERMQVNESRGFLDLVPGELEGFEAMRSTCLGLLDSRRPVLSERGKKAYLRPVLESNDYLAHPEIVTYCLNSKLLAAAADYLGDVATLSMAQLFWTQENSTASGSQQWHYDHVAPRQLKLFVYLNPVSPDNGPFTFLPADISDRFLQAMGKTWEEANTGSYDDAEVEARCGAGHARSLLGPAGAGGVVDTTRCLHFGGRARRGERAMMIIQYTRSGTRGDAKVRPAMTDKSGLNGLQRAALAA